MDELDKVIKLSGKSVKTKTGVTIDADFITIYNYLTQFTNYDDIDCSRIAALTSKQVIESKNKTYRDVINDYFNNYKVYY